MEKNDLICVLGYKGLVGSAIKRYLESNGYNNIIKIDKTEVDLINQITTEQFFKENNPEYIFLAAAKVGGILANSTYPAEFIYDNLMIQTNVINFSHKYKVKKLLFLGSSCIYPKFAKQPIKEEYLLTDKLEPTNIAYAIAKIAGIIMCQSYNKQYGDKFISLMPTNIYGQNDNFNLETAHVLPALIRKFHEAKINSKEFVEVWGTGTPFREFLLVDDLADAAVFLMKNYNSPEIINVGTGKDITIKDLCSLIKDIVGFNGDIKFDTSKPDGTPKKQLDISRLLDLGWKPKTSLRDGIKQTYDWYVKNQDKYK
ncbi:MAG: GDP-L-fucose synthase [Asgard group archaeon]|nr:GDP-L-fucose synthase [Asgard group archaeon]